MKDSFWLWFEAEFDQTEYDKARSEQEKRELLTRWKAPDVDGFLGKIEDGIQFTKTLETFVIRESHKPIPQTPNEVKQRIEGNKEFAREQGFDEKETYIVLTLAQFATSVAAYRKDLITREELAEANSELKKNVELLKLLRVEHDTITV
jgi:hypothetical protein